LWFRFGFGLRVKDTIQGYWFDCDGLLREAEEELATAF
jgi:hypothetical protein